MTLSSGLRALLAAASLVIVVAGLKIAAPVLVPTALAVFLAVITMPLVTWLRRRGVPNIVAIPIVILMTFGGFAGLVTIATRSLSEIRRAFPHYVERFRAMEGALTAWLGDRGIEIPTAVFAGWAEPERMVDLVGGALVGVAGFMSTTLVVLIVMIFILLEAHGFPAKIRAAAGSPDLDLSRSRRAPGASCIALESPYSCMGREHPAGSPRARAGRGTRRPAAGRALGADERGAGGPGSCDGPSPVEVAAMMPTAPRP